MKELIVPSSAANVVITDHGSWIELRIPHVEGRPDEAYFLRGTMPGAWCVPMNSHTDVRDPWKLTMGSGGLDAVAHKKPGIVGARVAVIPAGPQLAAALKEVVADSHLWLNRYGGPFALGHKPNYQSYLLSAPDRVTLGNVDQFIEICRLSRVWQLDWTHCVRYGDYEWPLESYPNGAADVRECVERLRDAGITSLLHCYGPWIDEKSKLPWMDTDTKPFDSGSRKGFLPTTKRLLLEVNRRVVGAMKDGGFEGIYLDAVDYFHNIQGPERSWYWFMLLLYAFGLRVYRKELIVETSMTKTACWNCVSRMGSQDQRLPMREFLDKVAGDCRDQKRLPRTYGWFKLDKPDRYPYDEDDLRYVCRRAYKDNAGLSFRGMCPGTWGDPRIQKAARLIAGRSGG